MRFFSHSFLYEYVCSTRTYSSLTLLSDPWSIVSLAFFLRYPNPYASHVISCDVISRGFTPSGSLSTTRLILKTATLPRWAPKGIISRSESWILEESEVDPQGKVVRCLTRNLEHVKTMQVHETQTFSQVGEGCVVHFLVPPTLVSSRFFERKTLQITEARIVSGFGWGLTRQIENYGLARFRKNVQRVSPFKRPVLVSHFFCSRVKVLLSFSISSVRLVGSPCRWVRHTSAPPAPVVSRLPLAPLTITDPSRTNSPDLMISLTGVKLDVFGWTHRWTRFAKLTSAWNGLLTAFLHGIYPTSVAFLFGTVARHRCISTFYCKHVVRVSRPKLFGVPCWVQATSYSKRRSRRHKRYMYFPTSVARQLCTVPSLPNVSPEPVLRVTPSPHKSLFCTLTRDGIAIWRVKVCLTCARLLAHNLDIRCLAVGHPHVSFKNIYECERARRKQICPLVY